MSGHDSRHAADRYFSSTTAITVRCDNITLESVFGHWWLSVWCLLISGGIYFNLKKAVMRWKPTTEDSFQTFLILLCLVPSCINLCKASLSLRLVGILEILMSCFTDFYISICAVLNVSRLGVWHLHLKCLSCYKWNNISPFCLILQAEQISFSYICVVHSEQKVTDAETYSQTHLL